MRPGAKVSATTWAVEPGTVTERLDQVVAEEPMEIRVAAGGVTTTVAVTMRTPGHDFELAAGFLHNEGVVSSREDLSRIVYCADEPQNYNVVTVNLRNSAAVDLPSLERHFLTSSACGVCGAASLESLEARGCAPLRDESRVAARALMRMPEQMRNAQGLFQATGGIHAVGLFDLEGTLIEVREDVGRHNALDKLVGWALLEDRLPLRERALLISGRASYEMVQKSLVAGISIVCAVSAPSSLAVAVARQFGITLVGFLRGEHFNVYTGRERIVPD